MCYALVDTPLGPVGLQWEGGTLTGVDLEPASAALPSGETPPDPVTRQLGGYFADGRAPFDLPLDLGGTDFQRRVWAAMQAIPAGQTRTYGAIATELGSAPRAVGQACRANPCPIVVPCHRVVGARGLGGFAGDTSGRKLAVKRWLLTHEGVRNL
ncbi:MAG: cysteine methyltransferase [Chromatiaceae bacterium]|nr:cysteine methyltransferase [Chromatiaceae bacterium]